MKPNQPSQPEPFPREPIPPDILAWARQTLDMDDFMAQVQEIRATGGVQFEDIFPELKARATGSEPDADVPIVLG